MLNKNKLFFKNNKEGIMLNQDQINYLWSQLKNSVIEGGIKVFDHLRDNIDEQNLQDIIMHQTDIDIQNAMVEGVLEKIKSMSVGMNSVHSMYPNDMWEKIKLTQNPIDEPAEITDLEHNYPPEYKIEPISDQVSSLVKIFPNLKVEQTYKFIEGVLPNLKLPTGAEGWFAVLRERSIATIYFEAMKKVINTIQHTQPYAFENKFTSKLFNWELSPWDVRQSERTKEFIRKINEQQPGDIQILPVQTGLKYRGELVGRTHVLSKPTEFYLTTLQVGCILITHPNRLIPNKNNTQLGMLCGGDQYTLDEIRNFEPPPASFCFKSVSYYPKSFNDPSGHGPIKYSLVFDGMVIYPYNRYKNVSLVSGFLPK